MTHPKITEIEYLSDEDAEKAGALCGAISEIISNWMRNNNCTDPYVVLAGLAACINVTVKAAPCGHCRDQAAMSVIDMILGDSNVATAEILRGLALLGDREGRYDA